MWIVGGNRIPKLPRITVAGRNNALLPQLLLNYDKQTVRFGEFDPALSSDNSYIYKTSSATSLTRRNVTLFGQNSRKTETRKEREAKTRP